MLLCFSKNWHYFLLSSLTRQTQIPKRESFRLSGNIRERVYNNSFITHAEIPLSWVWRKICCSPLSLVNPFESVLVLGFACRCVTAHPNRYGDCSKKKSNVAQPLIRFSIQSIWSSVLLHTPFLLFPQCSRWQPEHTWACLSTSQRSTWRASRTGGDASCELGERPPCQAESKLLNVCNSLAIKQPWWWWGERDNTAHQHQSKKREKNKRGFWDDLHMLE